MPFQGPAPGAEGSMVNANGQFDMNAMMMMGMVRSNILVTRYPGLKNLVWVSLNPASVELMLIRNIR